MKTLKNKWGRYLFQIPGEGRAFRIGGIEPCEESRSRLGCFGPGVGCFGLIIVALNDIYIDRCYIHNRKLTYNRKQSKTRQEVCGLYENIKQ